MKKLTRRGFLRLTAGGLWALVAGCRRTPRPTPTPTIEPTTTAEAAVAADTPAPTRAATPTATPGLTLTPSPRPLVAIPADTIPLSGRWRFAVDPEGIGVAQGWADPGLDDGAWTEVTVPHTWGVMEAYANYDGLAWYRRTFALPAEARDAHLRLYFAAVFYAARVWLNGAYLGEHAGGYTPFEFDVSGIASPGVENTLAVQVDNQRTMDRIPATLSRNWSFDWWNYGGIVRDVTLKMASRAYIARQQVVAVPHLVGIDAADTATVTVTATVRNASSEPLQGTLRAEVMDDATGLPVPESASSAAVGLAPGERVDIQLIATLPRPRLWHFDHPHLYRSSVSLAVPGEQLLHSHEVTFGVRRVELQKARFALNGEPMRLVGLTRHADSPAHGLAETATVMATDYNDLKALNMVFSRPVHYPQHECILDYCDRNGILLIPEVPAWQLTAGQLADEQMRELEKQQLREMIEASLNHPSIWAWSVGNEYQSETQAGRAFTREMIAYVRTLDPTRPVGFASHRLGGDPAADATALADLIMMNQYFGTWHGPKDILGDVLDRIHALWPDKAVIISEYGFEPHWNTYGGPPSSALDPSRYYLVSERTRSDSEEADLQRQAVIAEQMALFRSKPYVAAAVFWTYQDYRTPSGFMMGVVDSQRVRRASWSLLRDEYAPLTIEPVVFSLPSGGRQSATMALRTRGPLESDMPAYILRGYSLHWTVTSPESGELFATGDLALPTLEPGSRWSGEIEWPTPGADYVLTIRVVRPTQFTVIERSYGSDGRLLAADSIPPAAAAPSAPDLLPASWRHGELEHYAHLEETWGSPPHLASGTRGVIAGTSNALAIRAGYEALRQGGSAVDAALVTSLAQIALNAGATVSYAGILAMACYNAATGKVHSLNAGYNVPRKETNPVSIPRFEPSGRSALVPGFMAGVQAAHSQFGRLPFETLFEPAISFAEEGYRVSSVLAGRIATNRSILTRLPEAGRVFTKEDGKLYVEGDWFRQPELAGTLRAVATEGADHMYRGPWGQQLVEVVQREGGKMVLDDLASYEVTWPEAAHTTYRGCQVYGPGAPSVGGTDAIRALDLLEAAALRQHGHYAESPEALFRFIEIVNRFTLLSHPSREPAQAGTGGGLWAGARSIAEAARRSPQARGAEQRSVAAQRRESTGSHTAAVVAVDQWGNVAAVVHTINTLHWGMTGIFVDGVSIPDSACFQPATMTRAGPGNRLPDSLTPLIVLCNSRQVIGCGAVGSGLHLETMLRLVNILEYGMDLKAAMDAPTLLASGFAAVEGSFADELLEAVRKRGLVIKTVPKEQQGTLGRGYWAGAIAQLQLQDLQAGAAGELNGCAMGY